MTHRRSRMRDGMTATVIGLFVCSVVTACASDTPKGPPPPTPDQVRSHADKTFDKLKQDEQERGTQPNTPR
jgi:hypothetical protein